LPPPCTRPRWRKRRIRSDIVDVFDAVSFAICVVRSAAMIRPSISN
jgi:hypothetical protein